MISTVYNKHYDWIMPAYEDKHFDLALIDVPYGINVGQMQYLTEIKRKTKQKNGTYLTAYKNKKVHEKKDWDLLPPPQEYFDELKRITHHQIIFGVDYVNWTGLSTGRIRWDKCVADGVSFSRYEVAYCSLIDDTWELPLLWSGMQQAKSLSEPTTQQGNKKLNEKRIHPCHKPVMLYDAILKRFGFPGMKVIDTHLGSGSSRISCDKFGVDEFVGCDIDAEYFNDQEKRWKRYKSQQKINFQPC